MPLEDALARVPFLGGYLGQQQFEQQQQAGQLGQMGSLLKIQEMMRQKQQEQDLNTALKASGGDLEKALPALIQAGHIKGEHLTAAMKLLSDAQAKREAIAAMKALNAPQGTEQTGQPQELGAGQPIAAEPGGLPKTIPVDNLNEPRIAKLKAMQVQYSGNPVVSTQIQKEIDKLEAAAKPMVEHNFPVGDNQVQPHISFNQGRTWQPIPGSVPSNKFSNVVDPASVESNAKMISEYKLPPLTGFALRNPGAQQIMKRVSELNPQYNAMNYVTVQATQKDFTSGQTAKNITGLNQAIAHMGTLDDLFKAMENKDIPTINRLVNIVKTETGNPQVTNAALAGQAVSDELMRVFRQVGASQQEAEEFRKKFMLAGSPQQQREALKTAAELLNGRLTALQDQWKRGAQTKQDFPILGEKPKAALEKLRGGAAPSAGGWTPEKEKRYQELKALQNAP